MVYCGLFPTEGPDFEDLRDALGKLQLNDAALQYEPDVRAPSLRLLPALCCRVLSPMSCWGGRLSDDRQQAQTLNIIVLYSHKNALQPCVRRASARPICDKGIPTCIFVEATMWPASQSNARLAWFG